MFFTFFCTPVSRKRLEVSKCAKQVNYCKFKDLQIWYIHFFDIPNGFLDILKKTVFEKKNVSGARGRKNVLTWIKTRLKYLPKLGIESLTWTAQ